MKVTPHKGEGKREVEMMSKMISKKREVKTRMQVLAAAQGPPITNAPPSLALETPLGPEEMIKCIADMEQLEEVGRSPQFSLTQQLVQMATEAGPSMSGGEEPAQKKLWPTVGGKAPQRNSCRLGK